MEREKNFFSGHYKALNIMPRTCQKANFLDLLRCAGASRLSLCRCSSAVRLVCSYGLVSSALSIIFSREVGCDVS